MKVAGHAWLEFTVDELDDGRPNATVRLTQRAVFYAQNLRGRLYWRSMAPFHRSIFPTMLENIIEEARTAESRESSGTAEEAR
jgi:hypothetical protein